MRQDWTLARRIRVGFNFGVTAAILFSLLATIARLGMGTRYSTDLGISYWATVLIYFTTLPVGGVIGGLGGRLFRWSWGSFVMGFLVTLLAFVVTFLVMDVGGNRVADVELGAVFSAIIGGGGFLIGWFRTPHPHHNMPPE